MSKSNFLEAAVLNHFLRNTAAASPATVYAALSTADPTEDASGLAEPAGAWYARQPITFGAPGAQADAMRVSNSAEVDYTNSGNDPVTADDNGAIITHFAIFDAAVGGNMSYFDALEAPKTLNEGDAVRFPVGSLTVDES